MSHMYTKSKIKEICNLMDARWKTEEKILQYRGLLTIFGRERKKEINEANKIRRQQALHLQELQKDVSYFRHCLGESVYGNKQRVRNALQGDREIQLCYQRLWPEKVLEFFDHALNNKQKELDLLRYKKAQRMARFTSLKLERAELQDRLEMGFESVKKRRAIQILTNRIEMFVVRQNAAAQVYKLYKNMLNLLQHDAHYFDAILVVLYSVCDEQCRCVLQAAELGQLAQEDLGDIREEYKWLEREVKVNMKERKREVLHIKKVAEELLLKCRMLTRVESFGYDYEDSDRHSLFGISKAIEKETESLEILMKKVQMATLSPTYFDIFPRMLEQLQQEETLLRQMKKMRDHRNRVLQMKDHSQSLLASVLHTVSQSAIRFNKTKTKLEKEVEDENFRLGRENEANKDYVDILVSIRMALVGLYETVTRLKEVPVVEKLDSSSDNEIDIEMKFLTPEQLEETFPEPVEKDTKALLDKIASGLGMYQIYAFESLDDETLHEAQVSYQNEALSARSALGPVLEYDVPLLDDREMDDAGVLTRAQVKLQSKQIVEEHQRIALQAYMQGGPKSFKSPGQ